MRGYVAYPYMLNDLGAESTGLYCRHIGGVHTTPLGSPAAQLFVLTLPDHRKRDVSKQPNDPIISRVINQQYKQIYELLPSPGS